MDAQMIFTAIGSLGFPIVACCVLFWYLNEERKSHAIEIKELRKSLDRNTAILEKLKDIIQFLDRRGKDIYKDN